MNSLEVVAHGLECVAGIVTSLHGTVEHRALVVNLRMLLEIPLVLKSGITKNK